MYSHSQNQLNKEVLITNLKSQQQEIEEIQNNYFIVSKKYHSIKQDYALLLEQKNNQDIYVNEMNNKLESQCRIIKENEENIKKLYEDNSTLQMDNNRLLIEHDNLNLKTTNLSIDNQKLLEDNINLNSICNNQENIINQFKESIKALESKCFQYEKDSNNSNKHFNNEVERLERVIRIRDDEQLDLKSKYEKVFLDNSRLVEDNYLLSGQNQSLIDKNRVLLEQLEMVKDQDDMIRSHLQRRIKLGEILKESRNSD